MIATHMRRIVSQLVNSRLESTRVHWRTFVGLPEHLIHDPQPVELIWDEDPIIHNP